MSHDFWGGLGLVSFCAWVFVWYFLQTSVCGIGGAGWSVLFWLCFVVCLVAGWWQGGGGEISKKWYRGQLLAQSLQKIFFQFRMGKVQWGWANYKWGGIIDRGAVDLKM